MIALDKNRISDRNLIERHRSFLVPDCALYEDIKTANWEIDLERTFQVFRDHPEKLNMAQSVANLLRREMDEEHPVKCPLDSGGTMRFRAAVVNNFIETVRDGVEKLHQEGFLFERNLPIYRARIQSIMNIFEETGLIADIRHWRQEGVDQVSKAVYMLPSLIEVAREAILRPTGQFPKLSDSGRRRLCHPRSMTFRYVLGLTVLAMRFEMGSPDLSMKDEKLINELLDIEYAVIGSCCDTIASGDGWTKAIYKMLRKAKCSRCWKTGWKARLLPILYRSPI